MKILTRSIRIAWKKNIREISPENNIFVRNIPNEANEFGIFIIIYRSIELIPIIWINFFNENIYE